MQNRLFFLLHFSLSLSLRRWLIRRRRRMVKIEKERMGLVCGKEGWCGGREVGSSDKRKSKMRMEMISVNVHLCRVGKKVKS
jgi:hypothetical protein